MASEISNDIFDVYRGTEEQITNLNAVPIKNGNVYFAYDNDNTIPTSEITASKLYFDANSHRYVVSGGGDVAFIKALPGVKPQEDNNLFWVFNKGDIDARKIVIDNIIITSENIIYRVVKISEDGQTIYTKAIAGGGASSNANPLVISWIENFPARCLITEHPVAKVLLNSRTATINRGIFTVYCNGVEVVELSNASQEINSTSVTLSIPLEYLKEGTNDITLKLTAAQYELTSTGAVVMFRANFAPRASWNPLKVYGSDSAAEHLITYDYNFAGLSSGIKEDTLVQGLIKVYFDDELIKEVRTWGDSSIQLNCGVDTDEGRTGGDEALINVQHGNHSLRYDGYVVVNNEEYPVQSYWYDIIFATAEGDTKPIIISSYREDAEEENYNIIHIPYVVYQKGKEISELHQYINGEELPTSPIAASYDGTYDTWNISTYVVDQELQPNVFILRVEDVQREFNVTILPSQLNLDAFTSNLCLYLTAKDRSNKESLTSRKNWSFKKDATTTYSAILENFNWYNNGWEDVALEENEIQKAIDSGMSENDARQLRTTVLRLTNGAKVTIPFNEILQQQKLEDKGFTIEVEFKCRNALNYAKLLSLRTVPKAGQEDVPEDERQYEVVKDIQYDANGNIANAVGTFFNNGIGLAFGTQEAMFASSTKIVNVRYADNDKVKVSVVADKDTSFLYVYINGVLSGVEHWPDNTSFAAGVQQFVFNSDYCDLDIYNIRVYKSALTFDGIVTNWIGDAPTLETKLSRYEENSITRIVPYEKKSYVTLDYEKTVALSKKMGSRFLAANKPVGMQKGMPIMVISTYGDDKLPYQKGVKVYCDIRFYDPNGEVPKVSGKQLFGFKCRNVELDVQGTSSQGYPRRNFKAKIKDPEGKSGYTADYPFELDTWDGDDSRRHIWSSDEEAFATAGYEKMKKIDIGNGIAETSFCFKADYMESSSSHNTPLANYIQLLYNSNMGLQHPLSKLLDNINTNYRTTVYGFPMLIFHEKKNSTEAPEFVGRYNFNIDKGATTSFGFSVKEPHKFLHSLTKVDGTIKENPTYKDVAECWELKSNMHGFTGFRRNDFDAIGYNSDLALNIVDFYNFFENRYSGDDFKMEDMYKADTSVNKQDTHDKLRYYMRNLQALSEWIYSTDVHPWDTNDLTSVGTHKLSATPVNAIGAIKYRANEETHTIELMRDYYIYSNAARTQVTKINDWFNAQYDEENDAYNITVINPTTSTEVPLNTIYEDEINAVLPTPVSYITRDSAWDAEIVRANEATEEEKQTLQQNDTTQDYIRVNKTYYLTKDAESGIPTSWYHINQIMGETQKVNENGDPVYIAGYGPDDTIIETLDPEEALGTDVQDIDNDGRKIWVKSYEEDGVTIAEVTTDETEAIRVDGKAVPKTHKEPTPALMNIVESEEIVVTDPETHKNISITNVFEKFERDTKNYRLSKYHAEFNDHLNFQYCAAYFILTELFIMYDSREKNMMLASWGPEKEGGEYIWYPIFYDMDTQLGINNSGSVYWDYDVNAQDDGIFSGAGSVLWDNFYTCFLPEVKSFYIDWRKNGLNVNNCIKYYNTNSADTWTPIMKNADAFYKYIAPTISEIGFIEKDNGNKAVDSEYIYLYCAQGDRSLNRAAFFRNRFNYKDSEWLGGAYSSMGGENIEMRYDANWTGTSDPDALTWQNDSTKQAALRQAGLDATAYFNITPYLTQYVSVYYDEIVRRSDENNSRFDVQNPPVNGYIRVNPLPAIQEAINQGLPLSQQLVYIQGPSYLRDIGDLSTKYLDRLTLGSAIRLNRLVLGNDDPNYRNDGATSETIRINSPYRNGSSLNPNAKALLQYLDLSNLSAMTGGLDVSGCLKLQTARLLGSSLNSITLPEGNVVETLYLPAATEDFVIIQGQKLRKIIRSRAECITSLATNNTPATGLYIENITDKMDINSDPDLVNQYMGINVPIGGIVVDNLVRNNIKKYYLQGGVLGLNSYEILDYLVKTKIKMNLNPTAADKLTLFIRLLNVDWTPYMLLDDDAEQQPGVTYYIRNANNSYSELPAGIDFDYAKKNLGGVYSYDSTKILYNKNAVNDADQMHGIPNLDILKLFIHDYEDETKLVTNQKYIFRDTYEFGSAKYLPRITGDIYVDNDEEHPINEYDLYAIQEKYNANLTLDDVPLTICAKYVTNCPRAQFIEVVDNIQNTIAIYRSPESDEPVLVFPEGTSKIADCTRTHYDFRGWVSKADAITYGLDTFVDENGVPVLGSNSIVDNDSEILNHLANLDELTFSTELNKDVYYAVYTIHNYRITYVLDEVLYNENPSNPKAYEIQLVPSGQFLSSKPCTTIPWKSSDDLDIFDTYVFKGWAYKNETSPRKLERIRSQNDVTLYPIFGSAKVYENPIPEEDIDYVVTNTGTAYIRKIKKHLGGKVTIPKTLGGYPVVGIASSGLTGTGWDDVQSIFGTDEQTLPENNGLQQNFDITHLFFEGSNDNTATIQELMQYALYDMEYLTYLDMPPSLVRFGGYCCQNCYRLGFSSLSNATFIGTAAFNSCNLPPSRDNPIPVHSELSIRANPGLIINGYSFNSSGWRTIIVGSESEPLDASDLQDEWVIKGSIRGLDKSYISSPTAGVIKITVYSSKLDDSYFNQPNHENAILRASQVSTNFERSIIKV